MERAESARKLDWALAATVMVAVMAMAVVYANYWPQSRIRWSHPDGDPHAHCWLCIQLANDLTKLDFVAWWLHFDTARSWPPLHAILGSMVQLVAGPDHRLAVIPSLLAWGGTMVGVFLVARRLTPTLGNRASGNFAGAIAALFVLTSPSHRIFAIDVMLESLGCFLSVLAIYFYVRGRQEGDAFSFGAFGLTMSALFLEKYQYWVLLIIPIALAELCERPIFYLKAVLDVRSSQPWTRLNQQLLWGEARRPTSWLFLLCLAAIAWIRVTGGGVYEIFGAKIVATDVANLAHVAFIVFFYRLVLWHRNGGQQWLADRDVAWRQVCYWHVLPICLWFLLPKRLGYVCYYLSKRHTTAGYPGFWASLERYFFWAGEYYHEAASLALVALILALIGLLALPRLKAGSRLLPIFLVVAAAASAAHPQQMTRCMHSWIEAAWILAGCGGSVLLYGLASRWMAERVTNAFAAIAAIGLTVGGYSVLDSPGISGELMHKPYRASLCMLDLSEDYLPWLGDSRKTAFFGTLPLSHFAEWTFLERYPERSIEAHLKGFTHSEDVNRQRFEKWLERTKSDHLVFVDIRENSPFHFDGFEHYKQFRQFIADQSRFRLVHQREFPDYQTSVQVFERVDVQMSKSSEANQK